VVLFIYWLHGKLFIIDEKSERDQVPKFIKKLVGVREPTFWNPRIASQMKQDTIHSLRLKTEDLETIKIVELKDQASSLELQIDMIQNDFAEKVTFVHLSVFFY
jgi:hypothetical protein